MSYSGNGESSQNKTASLQKAAIVYVDYFPLGKKGPHDVLNRMDAMPLSYPNSGIMKPTPTMTTALTTTTLMAMAVAIEGTINRTRLLERTVNRMSLLRRIVRNEHQ